MHESDQASFVRGAIQLIEGRVPWWSTDFYNYDKQFGTYWILALAGRGLPGVDLIFLGNLLNFGVFWTGFLAVVWRAPMRSGLQASVIFACALSPTVWIHSPFLASAFLSAGFLLWVWAVVQWRALGRARWGVGGCLFGLAVACRVDALLLLPLMLWSSVPQQSLVSLLRYKRAYAAFAIAGGVIALGKGIFPGDSAELFPPFFYPKVFAAFVLFGLGVAVLPLGLHAGLLFARIVHRPRQAVFYALGLVALVAPAAFYSFQLFSPRYWLLTICAQVIFAASPRGAAFLAGLPGRKIVAVLLTVTALAPVIVGVRVPRIPEVKPVLTNPTVFPSADGLIPMGAFFWYTWQHRPGAEPFDHNEATWRAARSMNFEIDADGFVPILPSALHTYIELAIEMRGLRSRTVRPDVPFFYVDKRQILRANNAFTGLPDMDRQAFLSAHHFEPASEAVNGYQFVKGRPGPSMGSGLPQDAALARLFDGAEFSPPLAAVASALKRAAEDGRVAVVFASAPFFLVNRSARKDAKPVEGLGYAVYLDADDVGGWTVPPGAPGSLEVVTSRLPAYMSVQNF